MSFQIYAHSHNPKDRDLGLTMNEGRILSYPLGNRSTYPSVKVLFLAPLSE